MIKSILKKTLMSLGVIALLFFSNTAAGAEGFPQHNSYGSHIPLF